MHKTIAFPRRNAQRDADARAHVEVFAGEGRFDPPVSGYEKALLTKKVADGELPTGGIPLAGRLYRWRQRGQF